jgi:hypothetical protein
VPPPDGIVITTDETGRMITRISSRFAVTDGIVIFTEAIQAVVDSIDLFLMNDVSWFTRTIYELC